MSGTLTYREALNAGASGLRAAEISDADSDAWILLEHVTGMSRARFFADGNLGMKPEEEKAYLELIAQRRERIPVQHLTGVQEFMGYEFKVSRDVLIPRQDTEILVEEAEHCIRRERLKVLDMCTGSGCIAVSIKKRNPEYSCTGADISGAALAIARENAEKLDAEVEFVSSDMFSDISETDYDLIVSNPPYIPTRTIAALEEEVRVHDPFGALDGGEDGLHFYRILAKESPRFLKSGGWLCMEIGHDQSKAVEELLRKAGFHGVYTKKDLAGLDRVVCGVYHRD